MSARISWDDQRAFLAVVEEGSLSGAARRLGVTQPTVRARIAALERDLGTVLFIRSVNGLAATDHAQALAAAARTMARASDAFARAASAPPGALAGTVRLSVAEFVGIVVLPPMLADLRATHPGIAVEVSLSNAAADLLDQEVDVAVRMHPPRQDALVAKKVGAIALGLFAHRDYLTRRGVPRDAADLARHDIVGPDRNRADLALADALLPDVGRERFVVRTDSHPAQLAFARAGLGIVVAHRAVGRADPDLVQLLPEIAVPAIDTWIVMHENLRQVPRVRALFDHLSAAFNAYAQINDAMVIST